MGTCECSTELSGSIKCQESLTRCEPVSFSRTLLNGVTKLITVPLTFIVLHKNMLVSKIYWQMAMGQVAQSV
jgi:hypothetical protein